MAHILPHWTWPDRAGQFTPVHVYTSGDEAELFLNGKSQGRKKKGQFEYRLRWDDVMYQPGELKVIAYKGGKKWAQDIMKTAGQAAAVHLEPDRATINADGKDLCFITASITDKNGQLIPRAKDRIIFSVSGPGQVIATDNGDPTSFEPFQAPARSSFNGLCLAIVRSTGEPGTIRIKAGAFNLNTIEIKISAR